MKDYSKYNSKGTILREAQMRLLQMLLEVDSICKKHNITYWIDGGTPLGAVRHGGFIPWDDDIDIALLRDDYLELIKILNDELPDQFVLQNRDNEKFFHLNYSRVVDKNSLSDYGEGKKEFRKKIKHQGIFVDIVYVERGNLQIKKVVDSVYRRVFFNLTLYSSRFKKIIAIAAWPCVKSLVFFLRKINFIFPADHYIFGYGIPFNRNLRISEILPTKTILFEGEEVRGPGNVHAYLKRYYGDYMKIPPVDKRETHAERIEIY